MTKKEIVDIIRVEFHGNGNYVEAFEKAADKILAEEAKEKPTPYYVSDEVLAAYLAKGITALHGRPLVPYEKLPPTAPASLVEELKKWAEDKPSDRRNFEDDEEYGAKLSELGCKEYVLGVLSRYRPSTQTDIVGELKELERDGSSQIEDPEHWRRWLGKIIAKHEGDK